MPDIFYTGGQPRPQLADWQTRDNSPTASSSASAIPQLSQLINEINRTAQAASNAGRIQNATGLQGQSSGNISQALSGRLPQDVINQIGQASAERGVMSGSPLGAGANADYLRALGLSSLDMQNTGEGWLTGALGRNPGAPLFDATSQLMTPYQQGQLDLDRQRLALDRSRSGGGGGGGGRAMAPSTGYGGGEFIGGGSTTPINWGDLFPSNFNWLDEYGVAPQTGGDNLSWPTTGQGASSYNWMDEYGVTPDWMGDINSDAFAGYA